MITTTLRKNLGPPMPKQNDDSCLQEDQGSYSTGTFLCPAQLMLRISNFFLDLLEITLYLKFHNLIPLKRNSSFMRYLFVACMSGKWSENFLY